MFPKQTFVMILFFLLPIQKNAENNLVLERGQIVPDIARLIMDQSLAKINNGARKNVITDMYSLKEEYPDKQAVTNNRPKSRQEKIRTITGRPNLDNMSIDKLYDAFVTRFDFFIDNENSTEVFNNIRYALIKFTPKPKLSNNTVTDTIINHTAGKVYINLDNYEIIRIEGGAKNHFITTWRAWWSPFSFRIDVYEFSFSIDYAIFNSMVIEKNLSIMVDYEIRSRGVEKYNYILSNYRMRM